MRILVAASMLPLTVLLAGCGAVETPVAGTASPATTTTTLLTTTSAAAPTTTPVAGVGAAVGVAGAVPQVVEKRSTARLNAGQAAPTTARAASAAAYYANCADARADGAAPIQRGESEQRVGEPRVRGRVERRLTEH